MTKTKKVWVGLLAVILCLGASLGIGLPLGLKDAPQEEKTHAATQPADTTKYWGEEGTGYDIDWAGSGTMKDPWIISSAAQLAGLAYTIYYNTKSEYLSEYGYYADCYFKQIVDIDVSDYYWQPIGIYYDRSGASINRAFVGNYDGNGHIVSGVFTKAGFSNEYSYQGLFGYVGNKSNISGRQLNTIKSLGVVDSYIQGYYYVGGIVGRGAFCSVINCFNQGSVKSEGNYCGGIMGDAEYSSIISNCCNLGSVIGKSTAGGIVGTGSYGLKVTNCFSSGSVTATYDYAGGIIGSASYPTTIVNCFFTAYINIQYGKAGGIVGKLYSSNVSNCYYGHACFLSVGVGDGTDNTIKDSNLSDNFKLLSWYSDSSKWDNAYPWDFSDTGVWTLNSDLNHGYPVHLWRLSIWTYFAADSYDSGSGTAIDPYIIKTPEQMAKLAKDSRSSNLSGSYFKLGADIDLSEHAWQRLDLFNGTFTGDFYTITGMHTAYIKGDYRSGLFGELGGVIDSLILTNGVVFADGDGGAIASVMTDTAVISNCIVDNVDIMDMGEFQDSSLGGIATFGTGTIKNCIYRNGSIISSNKNSSVAGIKAGMTGGEIINCAVQNVTLKNDDGLIAGICADVRSGNVNACFFEANIVSKGMVERQKLIIGASSDFSGYFYNQNINGGYPIPKTLISFGEVEIPSETIYNALISNGFKVA